MITELQGDTIGYLHHWFPPTSPFRRQAAPSADILRTSSWTERATCLETVCSCRSCRQF